MFQVLHSSAGAGKTHALVRHYLKLALAKEDPAEYSHILALTFTNKAAGEMRERILHYLEGLARESEPSGALADVMVTLTAEGMDPATIKRRAGRTLKHMLHHWPQLAVSTIDAFTRRVVMPFARDLRLDSELRMTTDEQDLRDMAVDRLLEEAGSDAPLTELLLAICEELIEQERDWRADKPLRELSRQLTKEEAVLHLEQLRTLGNAHFLAVRERTRERTRAFRDRLRSMGRRALDAIEQAGLQPGDLAHGRNGPFGYLRALEGFDDWLDERPSTMNVLLKDKWYSTKASPEARAEVERIAPLLHDTISAVEELRERGELRRHAIACAVLRDLLPSAALHLLDERLDRIKQEEGLTFFSDLVKKVAAIAQREPAPFLYERLGEKYTHFLIDEFQDTSLLQWHALLPLITNALSTGGTALLVGDAKQAIYRWRNGEARQFTQLPRLFGKERMFEGDVHEAVLVRSFQDIDPLADNHRSAHGIIRFNNALFDALREQLPDHLQGVYRDQAQNHRKTDEGFIRTECFAKAEPRSEEGPDEPPAALAFTLASVEESLADGFLPGDIAVLVRTGAQGRAVSAQLIAAGHDVVSPDGLSIGGDPTVREIVAVLSWIHRPDDVSAAHAAQAILMRDPSAADPAPAIGAPGPWMRNWQEARTGLNARKPLFALIHAIARSLGIDPSQDAFVLGLLNEAHAFTQEHGDHPLAFLDHWDRVAESRSIGGADNLGAIRVMTVHKSKGLQFPVVIVPYADMDTRGPRDALWIDPGDAVEELPAALVRPSQRLDALAIPEVVVEGELSRLDQLDLLYVAFTRPEHRLYAGFDGGRATGLGAAVRSILHLAPGERSERGVRAPANVSRKQVSDPSRTLAPASTHGPVLLAIRREAPASWDPADPDPFRSRGRALHAILARVRTVDDLDAALAVEAGAWGLDEPDLRDIRERLDRSLRAESLIPFFGPGLEVRTEAAIIDADGRVHRPDRIVRDERGTRILDIKTGAPSGAHHDQVARYVRLLRSLGEPRASGHLFYLEQGTIVDVEGDPSPAPA